MGLSTVSMVTHLCWPIWLQVGSNWVSGGDQLDELHDTHTGAICVPSLKLNSLKWCLILRHSLEVK